MNINEIKNIVDNTTENLSKSNDKVMRLTKESPFVRGIKCNGIIIISEGIDIDMRFDTIDINSIDNTGMYMSNDNVLERNYLHFYDNNNGNELQIPFDNIFNVVLDDDNSDEIISTEFKDPYDFAVKLNHLEKWHRYSAHIIVKSVDFEIFDIDLLLSKSD